MRHTFQFLFSSALLLGFCIILNVQKSDHVTPLPYNSDIIQEKLQAASCNRSSADLASWPGNMAPVVFTSHSENPDHHQYQNSGASLVRSRTQKLIYLELKPLLFIQSGQYFHIHRSPDDPALS